MQSGFQHTHSGQVPLDLVLKTRSAGVYSAEIHPASRLSESQKLVRSDATPCEHLDLAELSTLLSPATS